MNDDFQTLADAVLPQIRTRRQDLWRYAAANEHGGSMHDAIDLLETALEHPEVLPRFGIQAPTPQETYAVAHKALASAIRIIARADDSAGIIGDACRRLIELHPKAAALAQPQQARIADWFWNFHFNDEVDYFQLDPVAYAPALGERGLGLIRTRVNALREELLPQNSTAGSSWHRHNEFLVGWFDQRFSVLDRDFDAIIRTHLRDGNVAAWYEDVAEAFEEIGEVDRAIEWADRATMFNFGHQSQSAAKRWWRLLSEHRSSSLPAAAQTIFERWPTSTNGAKLIETVGEGVLEDVQAALEMRPTDLVRFQLDTMDDPALAWESAHRLSLEDAYVWEDLAEAYFPIDPVAAVEVQLGLVAGSLEVANTRRYRPAARELARIRRSARAASTEALRVVDDAIADLRELYARRPRLMAELDRAKLPPRA